MGNPGLHPRHWAPQCTGPSGVSLNSCSIAVLILSHVAIPVGECLRRQMSFSSITQQSPGSWDVADDRPLPASCSAHTPCERALLLTGFWW